MVGPPGLQGAPGGPGPSGPSGENGNEGPPGNMGSTTRVNNTPLIPYTWKYWWSSNLAVWPKTKHKKYWGNFNLAVALCSILRHHKHCVCVYQGALLVSRFRYLNKAASSQIYKKYNWQCASAELAICTCEGAPRVLLHALRHYMLRIKMILADFNLAVSSPMAKLPNLISRQIFQLYGMTSKSWISVVLVGKGLLLYSVLT